MHPLVFISFSTGVEYRRDLGGSGARGWGLLSRSYTGTKKFKQQFCINLTKNMLLSQSVFLLHDPDPISATTTITTTATTTNTYVHVHTYRHSPIRAI